MEFREGVPVPKALILSATLKRETTSAALSSIAAEGLQMVHEAAFDWHHDQ